MLYLILALVALGLISAIFGIISHRKGDDDEELDRFAGRAADNYTDEEVEEFSEVLYTMQPEEVAGMLQRLLHIQQDEMPKFMDATDALGAAYRHPLLMHDPDYDFSPSQKTMVSDNIKYITFRDTYGGDNDRTYFLQHYYNSNTIHDTVVLYK